MKKTKKMLLAILAVVLSTGVKAQDLVVTLTNSTTEIFAVSGIQSIKFGASSMILNESDGTITTWDINDIDNYSFDLTTSLSDQLIIESSNLNLYPNPSSDVVNLVFTTTQSTNITVEIVDANGKIVEQIYQGEHQGEQTYKWNSNGQSGNYYCRINTANKMITKPIVIQ